MGGPTPLVARTFGPPSDQGFFVSLVLVIMAVKTQQLPIAAVGWIMVVIVIPVVDSQFVQVLAIEFTGATPANPRVKFQRLLTVILLPLLPVAAGSGDDLIQIATVS